METVTLKQLETFACIVRLGSFAAAAQHLHTTQPSITGRIRELETSLQAELFDRSGHRAQLTVKGRELVGYADRMLALASEMRSQIGDRHAVSGIVRLGVIDNVALTWLPRLIANLSTEYPNIVLELFVDMSVNLHRKILSGELDMAILAGGYTDPHIKSVFLHTVCMTLVGQPSLPLPERTLTPEDLKDVQFICHTHGSHLNVAVQDWFSSHGCRPKSFYGCTSVATMISLASEGVGVACVAPAVVKRELQDGRLRVFATDPPMCTFSLSAIYPASNVHPAITILAELAARLAAQHVQEEGPG